MSEFFTNYLMPTKAVYTMWVLMALVILLSYLATRKITMVPGKLQNIAEMGMGKLYGFLYDVLGEHTKEYMPILSTFFIFIMVCNYSGIFPGAGELFAVPTAHLAVPVALGICAFVTIHNCGIKKKGLVHYLKSFTKPVLMLLPITLLEQVVRPLSLALRLYGNLYGEEQVSDAFMEMVPLVLPWVMTILSLMFCLIQAMIFTMLLAIYIGEAVEEEE